MEVYKVIDGVDLQTVMDTALLEKDLLFQELEEVIL